MRYCILCLVVFFTVTTAFAADKAIPWDQIGAKAGADYKGDGLSITPTDSGARLHCVFQRLDGDATPEGLWLTSTVSSTSSDHFRVTAVGINDTLLADSGAISLENQTVRFTRPNLIEEYSVSMDGIRQDFIVEQHANQSSGKLVVNLSVSGARVESAADGATLILENSGRRIAYSRLRVTDATGKILPAHIEVCGAEEGADIFNSVSTFPPVDTKVPEVNASRFMSVVISDSGAIYPLRIDPTFSDANWSALGSGMGGSIPYPLTLAVSGSTLYAGGYFTSAGGVPASCIAQWNGSSWSALGSGVSYGPYQAYVGALAVLGNTLYVGGNFTNAGGVLASNIAQWDGTNWSAMGSGMAGQYAYVGSMAVSGSTLYVGGEFSSAGGVSARCVAKWNGTNWSALGSGMVGQTMGAVLNPYVNALAVSGGTLYAGGYFTGAGGVSASCVAQWNGTNWSALGSGISGTGNGSGPFVLNLLPVGGTLYACGNFSTAGGVSANYIAQWNGSTWAPVGSGMSNRTDVLAVSGGTLYAAGYFTNAGGVPANYIAQWNGSSWAPLGSGLNEPVLALTSSGNTLYVGGGFTTAGTNSAYYMAEATLPVPLQIVTANSSLGFSNGLFGFDISGPPGSNVVIQASTNLQNWFSLQTNTFNGSGLLYFSDSQSTITGQRFYQAVLP